MVGKISLSTTTSAHQDNQEGFLEEAVSELTTAVLWEFTRQREQRSGGPNRRKQAKEEGGREQRMWGSGGQTAGREVLEVLSFSPARVGH